MSRRRHPDVSRLVIAAFSRYPQALDLAQGRLQQLFGAIERVSPDFNFHHTRYYEKSMGTGLKKRFLVFEPLRPSDVLPASKNLAVGLEKECALFNRFPEERPLNLDPGLLQLGKFILSTSKDQAHRIYLADGVYAEVTLRFEAGKFETWPWTYADYREPALLEFLAQAREALYQRLLHLRQPSISAEP